MRTLLVFALLACAATGQEEPAPGKVTELTPGAPVDGEAAAGEKAPAFDPMPLLAQALLGHRDRTDVLVRAEIGLEKPEGGGGGNAGMIMIMRGGGAARPYEGVVFARRDADGVVVVASEKEVPGFEIWTDGTRTVRRVTFTDDAPSLAHLLAELPALLDAPRLVRSARQGELTAKQTAGGGWTFTGPVPKEVVDAAAAAHPMAQRVLRAEAAFHVDQAGRLTGARITIVRNDPAAEMMRGGAVRVQIIGPGGQKVQPGEKKHDIEGDHTVYDLSFVDGEAPERLRAFAREGKRLAAADG